MELRVDISYNQILGLIRQLPKEDIIRITDTLKSEITSQIEHKPLQQLILKAPTWTESELNDFNEARAHMNQSRIA